MAKNSVAFMFSGICALSLAAFGLPARAQEEPAGDAAAQGEESAEPDTDNVADMLNSRQQLQQTFTLKRTVNGELVETEQRTVTYERGAPYRETEAGKSTVERLKESFDGEALTRTEAFEEAKLDFVIADANRDGAMTAAEFANLVITWRKNNARIAEAPSEEIAQQRKYDAFIAEIDPAAMEKEASQDARRKFAFMAGAAEALSLQDYIREQMLDFDSMDADNDRILQGDELMRFRALNRGEALN